LSNNRQNQQLQRADEVPMTKKFSECRAVAAGDRSLNKTAGIRPPSHTGNEKAGTRPALFPKANRARQ
jgi:hypothetical protein